MKLTKKFFCPVNGWDCPYHKDDWDGICCSLVDDGEDPIVECDDAASFYDTPGEGFVWADDNGMTWDEQELLEKGYHFINGEPVFNPILIPYHENSR